MDGGLVAVQRLRAAILCRGSRDHAYDLERDPRNATKTERATARRSPRTCSGQAVSVPSADDHDASAG